MLTHEMPTLRGQQRPFSTVNSCSWNNWNFIKWKIAHPWWNSNSRLFNYMPSALITELRESDALKYIIWDTGSGDLDLLL